MKAADGSFEAVVPAGAHNVQASLSAVYRTLYAVGWPQHEAVVVLRLPAGHKSISDAVAEQMTPGENGDHGFSRVVRMSVGGADVRGFSYRERTPVIHSEILIWHGGSMYLVNGTTSQSAFKDLQTALEQITKSWRWTGG